MSYGIVYIALDDVAYLGMTILSLTSLRKGGNAEPAVIITNIPGALWYGQKELNYVVRILSNDLSARGSMAKIWNLKPKLLQYSPFSRTLLLDSDTIIIGNIEEIWKGSSDVGVPLDRCLSVEGMRSTFPNWGTEEAWKATIDLVGNRAPYYNVGIMRFDQSSRADALFKSWQNEVNRWSPSDIDEIAFLRAIQMSKCPIQTLEARFNISYRDFQAGMLMPNAPFLLHFCGMPSPVRCREMIQAFRALFDDCEHNIGAVALAT